MTGTVGMTMVPSAPGRATLMLKSLQARSPWQNLADLQTVAGQMHLPPLHWRCDDTWGVTGEARGHRESVLEAVQAWADAFAVKVLTRDPKWMETTSGGLVQVPGFAVAQICLPGLDVTVAGRLAGKRVAR